jgi:hypothetical protein
MTKTELLEYQMAANLKSAESGARMVIKEMRLLANEMEQKIISHDGAIIFDDYQLSVDTKNAIEKLTQQLKDLELIKDVLIHTNATRQALNTLA